MDPTRPDLQRSDATLRFDPLHRWLGIPPAEQPADFYRLLGLTRFERDPAVIDEAADRAAAHLRTHQQGPHGPHAARLLSEVELARRTLLDAPSRQVYDTALRHAWGMAGASSPTVVARDPAPTPLAESAPAPPVSPPAWPPARPDPQDAGPPGAVPVRFEPAAPPPLRQTARAWGGVQNGLVRELREDPHLAAMRRSREARARAAAARPAGPLSAGQIRAMFIAGGAAAGILLGLGVARQAGLFEGPRPAPARPAPRSALTAERSALNPEPPPATPVVADRVADDPRVVVEVDPLPPPPPLSGGSALDLLEELRPPEEGSAVGDPLPPPAARPATRGLNWLAGSLAEALRDVRRGPVWRAAADAAEYEIYQRLAAHLAAAQPAAPETAEAEAALRKLAGSAITHAEAEAWNRAAAEAVARGDEPLLVWAWRPAGSAADKDGAGVVTAELVGLGQDVGLAIPAGTPPPTGLLLVLCPAGVSGDAMRPMRVFSGG